MVEREKRYLFLNLVVFVCHYYLDFLFAVVEDWSCNLLVWSKLRDTRSEERRLYRRILAFVFGIIIYLVYIYETKKKNGKTRKGN